MPWPAVAAAIGALGVASGIGGIQTGTSISQHSTLNPLQQLLAMQLMGSNMERMPGYYNTLGELGQNPQNPYSSLTPSRTSFYGNVELPMLQRQQQQLRDVTRDPSHKRINKIINDRMRQENDLAIKQMGAEFGNQNRQMEIQGRETSLSNQLNALSQMRGQFYGPLGVQMQENYYNPPTSIGSILGAGVSAAKLIPEYFQNLRLEQLINSGAGTAAAGGGF